MVEYNQEEDPSGAIGIALADAAYRREGWNAFRNDNSEREMYAKVARIALRRFPELQRGEHILDAEVSKRLRAIREAGYNVASYSRMNAVEKWNYLMSVKREVIKKVREYCPNVLVEINSDNLRRREEARAF